MKRMLPLLLALLLLTACGTAPAAPPPTEEPVIEDEASAAPTEAPGTDDTPAPVEEEEVPAAPVLSETFVTLDGLSSYLRLTLPEGWTWEQAEGPQEVEMLVLYPENDPAFQVEMCLWNEGFGMCGTGVTFSEYTLPNGQKATLAYEISGGSISWTLIPPEAPDSFTIQFTADMAVYEAHRAELELMLSTLDQGILAGLDPVKPAEETR